MFLTLPLFPEAFHIFRTPFPVVRILNKQCGMHALLSSVHISHCK